MRRRSPQVLAIAGLAAVALAGLMGLPSHASAKTHDIHMTAVESDIVIDGGGEKYAAWTFNGTMPGPVVRVTEGDTINFTLTNPATNKNPHAMDFHAAEIDFLKNYKAINAGETISYTFVAKKPGIGPEPDGHIPEEQQVPLRGLGAWLAVNGPAIYGTRPWQVAATTTTEGTQVRFTTRDDCVYALLIDPPGVREVGLRGVTVAAPTVRMLGVDEDLPVRAGDGTSVITLPARVPVSAAYALELGPTARWEG